MENEKEEIDDPFHFWEDVNGRKQEKITKEHARDWFNIEIPLTILRRGIFKAFRGSQIIAVDYIHRALSTRFTSKSNNFIYYASMEQIAEYANCSIRTASEYTNILIRMGLLERTFIGTNQNNSKSAYRLKQLTNEVLDAAYKSSLIEAKKLVEKNKKT